MFCKKKNLFEIHIVLIPEENSLVLLLSFCVHVCQFCSYLISSLLSRSLSMCPPSQLLSRYPDVSPEVYVSANDLQRGAQDLLNSSLHEYSSSLTLGEASLLLHIDWVREHAHSFFPPTPVHNLEPESDLVPGSDSHFCRMWLYMHHIYSKTKRRNILALADQLQLSGFCLPGKLHQIYVHSRVCYHVTVA